MKKNYLKLSGLIQFFRRQIYTIYKKICTIPAWRSSLFLPFSMSCDSVVESQTCGNRNRGKQAFIVRCYVSLASSWATSNACHSSSAISFRILSLLSPYCHGSFPKNFLERVCTLQLFRLYSVIILETDECGRKG